MSAPPMRKVRVMANDTQPMDVVVHGRQVQITQRFRAYVSDKLSRLDRFGVPLQVIDCEVIRQQNPRTTGTGFIVELTGRGRGPVIRAEARSSDQHSAFDLALDKLEQRLRRASDRRTDRTRRVPAREIPRSVEVAASERSGRRAASVIRPGELPAPSPGDESDNRSADQAPSSHRPSPEPSGRPTSTADVVYADGPIVVRDKTHPSSPMSVADALHAMELVGHDFFLFEDIETRRAAVVYRRQGYDYGLLRLEVS